MRYIVVGGNPVKSYTGTTTFLSLRVVAVANNLDEVKKILDENYNDCGGLICVIDALIGELA